MQTQEGCWKAAKSVLVAWLPLACALAGLLACPLACNGAKSPTAGTTVDGPVGVKADGSAFLVDSNFGGLKQELRLAAVHWGRLVDVFGLDGSGERVVMQREFVIAGGLIDEPGRWELEPNPVTGAENLIIQQDVTTEEGRDAFFQQLREAEANLGPVFDNGLGGSGLFSMVPRNAVLLLSFDDLLDRATVSAETVRLRTGAPSVDPFEARVFVDENHGDLADYDGDGTLEFHPTRLIVDPTISEFEAFFQEPPLNINGLGFPPSASVSLSNVQVRIPTTLAPPFGQDELLRNLSGHELSVTSNGTADLGAPTDDIVRAMRSGGPPEDTADPYNGFLRDDVAPVLVGQQRVFIETPPVQDVTRPDEFTIGAVRFDSLTCAKALREGDVLQQPFVYAEVLADAPLNPGGVVQNVRVRLLGFPDEPRWPGAWSGAALGDANLSSVFAPGAVPDACYVRFSPAPPDPNEPDERLQGSATATVRFSEPMDPLSVTSFDSLTMGRAPDPVASGDYVVGGIGRSQDLRSFTFVPTTNLHHVLGEREEYWVRVSTGAAGPRDLAGNRLLAGPPPIRFELDRDLATHRSGGRVTRFSGPDEDVPIGTDETGLLPEWNGQHSYDLLRGTIRPRPVSRFQVPIDRSQPLVSVMTPFLPGIQTPLSPFGCRMMHIYRYLDVGMNLTDTVNFNIDVEGMYWAPVNGLVTADNFPDYQIRMGHCVKSPDESTEGQTGCPRFPQSGLTPPFDGQVLTPDVSPMKLMHPRDRGYVVNPGESFITPSGTLVIPWPINRDPAHETLTYTWRDTAILGRGGNNCDGVDPFVVGRVGLERNKLYSQNNVQTIGLPLLVEHRCYPAAADAFGNNSLDIVLAPPMFRRPTFRAFSVGGFGPGGNIIMVDPDLEVRANGGFNPMNGGQTTPPTDPTVYLGAMDFVVRISRSVSVWFEANDPSGGAFDLPTYERPQMDPPQTEQPSGTRIEIAFRGASGIVPAPSEAEDPRFNANTLDAYGNHYADLTQPRDRAVSNVPVTFLGATEEWHELAPIGADNPTGIDGARYYQMRLTFVSNIDSGLGAQLSALAVAWE